MLWHDCQLHAEDLKIIVVSQIMLEIHDTHSLEKKFDFRFIKSMFCLLSKN